MLNNKFWSTLLTLGNLYCKNINMDYLPMLVVFAIPNSTETVVLTNSGDGDIETIKNILTNTKEITEILLEQMALKEENERTRPIQPN